jgi:hypothetical protein
VIGCPFIQNSDSTKYNETHPKIRPVKGENFQGQQAAVRCGYQ